MCRYFVHYTEVIGIIGAYTSYTKNIIIFHVIKIKIINKMFYFFKCFVIEIYFIVYTYGTTQSGQVTLYVLSGHL